MKCPVCAEINKDTPAAPPPGFRGNREIFQCEEGHCFEVLPTRIKAWLPESVNWGAMKSGSERFMPRSASI